MRVCTLSKLNLTFKISLIVMAIIDALAVLFFLAWFLLNVFKIVVFSTFHFYVMIIIVGLNLLYILYLVLSLIISNKKLKF